MSVQDDFEAFNAANPWVYTKLVALTRGLKKKGHSKIGMKMLWEVLRWNILMQTDTLATDFKLNNNYTSRYARAIMDREPDLKDAYETRELRT